MFGRMMVEPVVQLDSGVDLQTAVAALIKVAENVQKLWSHWPWRASSPSEGLQALDCDDDLLTATARELVQNPGIGEIG